MTQRIILTTRKMPGIASSIAEANYCLRQPENEIAHKDEILRLADGAHAILTTAFFTMDAEFMERLPQSVGIIASIGVGVDHIDLSAAARKGVFVSNTPEVSTPCLADATFGLIIAACRRFREGLEIARTGEGRGMLTPDSWGQRAAGRTLGIVGMGNVGRAVAKRAAGFDMQIIYNTPRPSIEVDEAYGAQAVDLDTLLSQADIISLHCPLKEETRHLIDASAIEKMKPSAVLINISRGPIVDEAALINALKNKRLFAAGLDVYETEPDSINKELRELPNVFCLPHIASATRESRAAMTRRALANIDAFFKTGAPFDAVA